VPGVNHRLESEIQGVETMEFPVPNLEDMKQSLVGANQDLTDGRKLGICEHHQEVILLTAAANYGACNS